MVEKLQTSMQSGKSIYDGWISDSDLIGTHYRYGKIMTLTDYMAGKGKEYTNPGPGPEGLHRHQLHDRAGQASSTSCPTSSSPTCTGSAPTCSRART